MIKQETAAKIWNCYREIETAKKLLEDLEKAKEDNPHNPHSQLLRDAFGRRKSLELGIPNGHNGHRLFDVSPGLADAVIKSHIAHKEAELSEMNERAKLEMVNQIDGMKIAL